MAKSFYDDDEHLWTRQVNVVACLNISAVGRLAFLISLAENKRILREHFKNRN